MNTHITYASRDRDLLILIMLTVFVFWMCSGVDVPLPYVRVCNFSVLENEIIRFPIAFRSEQF